MSKPPANVAEGLVTVKIPEPVINQAGVYPVRIIDESGLATYVDDLSFEPEWN